MKIARLSARVRANRKNALLSTGPKTPEGKARVSRNALFHGLACEEARVSSSQDVEVIVSRLLCEAADQFFGDGAALEVAAREFAHAQAHVLEVRRIRHRYWLSLVDGETEGDPELDEVISSARASGVASLRRMADAAARTLAVRTDPVRNLNALERYERQALARRKRAARSFSDLVAAQHAEASAKGRR
jgi:hypothetical protein